MSSMLRATQTSMFPTRLSVKEAQMKLAQKLRAALITELQSYCRSSPITIAMDGWTNVNMVKVTNVVLLCRGQAYYWCSIVNSRNHNTASWLRDALTEVMEGLQSKGLTFVGLVLDNEAVNGALIRLLEPTFPSLVHSPCAAHILQLCVDHTFKLPAVMPLLTSMEALIGRFRNTKLLKLKLKNYQAADNIAPRALRRPCITRWSSHLQAAERLYDLQRYVDMVEPQPPSFWSELNSLIRFLKPFQVATDTLQADSSTLYDTYKVFSRLQHHVDSIGRGDFFEPSKAAILSVILDMWDKHINLNAVVICASLSFDTDAELTFAGKRLSDAQEWFLNFATQYAVYWSLTDYTEPDQVKRAALEEWANFLAKSGSGFEALDERLRLMRPTDGGKFQPSKVWLLQRAHAPVIGHAAIAILSVAGSEAAVERSFSVQGLVHSNRRNRLNDSSIEAEMFIRLNEHLLSSSSNGSSGNKRRRKQTPLTVDVDDDDNSDEPMPSVVELFQRPAVAAVEVEAQDAQAAAAAVNVAEEMRVMELPAPPPVDMVEAFIQQYVKEQHVTSNYRWIGHRTQVLEGKAALHSPPIIIHTKLLQDRIMEYVEGAAAGEENAAA